MLFVTANRRDMTSFTVLLFISWLSIVTTSVSAACNLAVSCPCGSTNNTYTLCIDVIRDIKNPCSLWSNCRTCQDNLAYCVTCPDNRTGPTCLEGNHIRRKRQYATPKPRRLSALTINANPYGRSEVERGRHCRQPEADLNGYIEDTPVLDRRRKYPPGTQLTFRCREGYRSVGAVILYCLLRGDWSSLPPSCEETNPVQTVAPTDASLPNCRHPGIDPNGIIEETPSLDPRKVPQRFLPGTEITYSCKDGFQLKGPNVLFCLLHGEWSSSAPTCTEDSRIQEDPESPSESNCLNVGPISNGRIIAVYRNIVDTRRPGEDVSEYPPGTRLEYSCEPKYIVRGSSTLTCSSSGDWNYEPPICVEDCGLSKAQTTRKITNGLQTTAGEWPWTVAISPATNRNSVICGGALLDRRTVLTAAHCLVAHPAFALHFGKFKRRNSEDDELVKRRQATRILIHPDFNNVTYENDIALLRFEPNIRYTDRITPICLPTPNTTPKNVVPGQVGKVTGWGLNERKLQSDELMLAELPVQPDDECLDAYRAHGLDSVIYPGMFCAGYAEGMTSACRGDSGSPLVFRDDETNRYTIEGVVSFGQNNRECGSERAYTVFTKVAYYMPWVLRNWRRN